MRTYKKHNHSKLRVNHKLQLHRKQLHFAQDSLPKMNTSIATNKTSSIGVNTTKPAGVSSSSEASSKNTSVATSETTKNSSTKAETKSAGPSESTVVTKNTTNSTGAASTSTTTKSNNTATLPQSNANNKTVPTNNQTTPTPCRPMNSTTTNTTSKSNSSIPICAQPQSSTPFPWLPITITLTSILLILLIIYIIYTIRKRIQTTKKYNETPEHFIEKPSLSLNQQKNLKTHQVQRFKKYKENDCQVEEVKEYGGQLYELKFANENCKRFSAVYWTKELKTDCYFEVEIDTLESEVEFGFASTQYFGQLNDGIETKIGRIGVSINSEGNLQVYGEVRYQFKWDLEYGDVIGMGLTTMESVRRVWITKNGLLLNPPTQEQIQKWLTNQQLSNSHRDAYTSFSHSNQATKTFQQKKHDLDLIKRKVTLPASQPFKYHAVMGSWEVTGNAMTKSIMKRKNKATLMDNLNAQSELKTIVRVNVGGKMFRLRDHNLKSGLLADPIEKNQFCNWLPCFVG